MRAPGILLTDWPTIAAKSATDSSANEPPISHMQTMCSYVAAGAQQLQKEEGKRDPWELCPVVRPHCRLVGSVRQGQTTHVVYDVADVSAAVVLHLAEEGATVEALAT